MDRKLLSLSLFWRTFFLLSLLLTGGILAWVQTLRQLGELVAGEGLARVAHQCLEHREFAGGECDQLAFLRETAQRQVEFEGAEGDGLRFQGRRARCFLRRTAAQHRVHARQQLARVERLGQVVVGADLEADDAVDVLHLGGEHDDGRTVAGGAQPAADRQAILARQHQVEDDQVDVLARHQPVQGLAVLGQEDVEAFLAQIAAQQVADAGVVVEDDDTVLAGAWNC